MIEKYQHFPKESAKTLCKFIFLLDSSKFFYAYPHIEIDFCDLRNIMWLLAEENSCTYSS